jgi:hypothetical protein
MNLKSKTPKIELLLHAHELVQLSNRERLVQVSCKNGLVWVTCEGEKRDRFLYAGSSYTPKAKGNIVIEAIGESCIGIEENLN